MASRILRDQRDLGAWVRFLQAQELPITVSQIKGAKRSLPQNSTAAKWYSQIGDERGDAPIDVKAECKLTFGLPIMQRDNQPWLDEYYAPFEPLPYHMKLKVFRYLPLTSKFTTKQMAEYMDAVQREYRSQGIALIDPEARKYEQEFGPQ